MANILINKDTPMDLDKLIESRLLIQANSGGGKSYLVRRLLEQSHGKVQQIIIDPEGEFSTLREQFDYVLIGKDGDAPADVKTAGMLAKKLLELNASAIIDLYELEPKERKHFVRLFLEGLLNAPKELYHPCLVVIDEAHIFAPEHGNSEATDAVIGLASRGRKRQFCAVIATQRISKLHKDVAAECNNKLIGRTGLDIDRKRAGDELGFTSKEQFISLRTLEAGEFYAFGPAISMEIQKVKVGSVTTTHQQVGAAAKILPPPTSKIKEIIASLADLPQAAEREAVTVSDLQLKVRNLTQELGQLKRKPEVTKKESDQKTVIKTIEKPVVGKKAYQGINAAIRQLGSLLLKTQTLHKQWDDEAKKLAGKIITLEVLLEKVNSPTNKRTEEEWKLLNYGQFEYGKPIQAGIRKIGEWPKQLPMQLHPDYPEAKKISEATGTPLNEEAFAKDTAPEFSGSILEMWMTKMGAGANGKIFKFLVGKKGFGYTRQQLSLATGVAYNSVMNNVIPILKRNLLVVEQEKKIMINPDLIA